MNVRLDIEELNSTVAESKAIYSYVTERNDRMKVSNLYIAQVKAKYGILYRKNRKYECINEAQAFVVWAFFILIET